MRSGRASKCSLIKLAPLVVISVVVSFAFAAVSDVMIALAITVAPEVFTLSQRI
jgi:hypothetical protein